MDTIAHGAGIAVLDSQRVFVKVHGAQKNYAYTTINFGREENSISQHIKLSLVNLYLESKQNWDT